MLMELRKALTATRTNKQELVMIGLKVLGAFIPRHLLIT